MYFVDCECVSCVLAVSLSSLCTFRHLISKQQLTRRAAAGKRTAFSQVVSEPWWKVPKESTRQVVTGIGTTCVDEQNFEERTRKPTTSESERQIARTKLAERKVQFEAVEDRNSWVTFGIDERAQVYTTRRQKLPQDQDQLIVGE